MYWFVLQKSSAGKDGEPHLQDNIRRVRWRMQRCNRGGSRGKTHQTGLHPIKLLTLLGKTWLTQGLWNVPMGHILDPRRVTGDFQKPTVFAYYQIGRELSKTGCYIPRKLHEISNHHTDAYLSWKELATRLQLWKTIEVNCKREASSKQE